ncbi:MAG: NEW3 domain-containing protein [Bryobacteraceae bacterium]
MSKRTAGRMHLLSAFMVLACAAVWVGAAEEAQAAASRRSRLAEAVRTLNGDVLRRLAGPAMKRPAGREGPEVTSRLRERSALLRELIRTEPAEALRQALTPDALDRIRAAWPESSPLLEQHGQWQGTLETIVFEGRNHVNQEVAHFLNAGGKRLEVRLAGDQTGQAGCGGQVRLRGVRVGDLVAADEIQALGEPPRAASACATVGDQKIAVLLVTFPGVTPPAEVTPASVASVLFGPGRSLSSYWNEVSYQQTTASGAVHGWYTLDRVYSCTEYSEMRAAALAAADADVDFRNFSRIFIIFPDPGGCPWSGFSTAGCWSTASPDGQILASTTWMLAESFVDPEQGLRLAVRQGGHALGLFDSRSRRFEGEPLGPLGETGTPGESDDPFTSMGASGLAHYTAEQKLLLGWIPPWSVPRIQSTGVYTIRPLEKQGSGNYALQVQRGAGNDAWLWIEYRQPVGVFGSSIPSAASRGALIRYQDGALWPHADLLDFYPSTPALEDAPLLVGTSWKDPYTNLSLAVLEATPEELTIQVKYGSTPCTLVRPSLAIQPNSQSAMAGDSVAYGLTVKSNDSGACPSRTYTLAALAPQNWQATFSPQVVTLAPGQSATVTMNVTVPASAQPGTYPVDAGVVAGATATTALATLTVLPPPDPSMEITVNLGASPTELVPPGTVVFTAEVLGGGEPVPGVNVSFSLTQPGGSTLAIRFARTDDAGLASWSFRFRANDPKGDYIVTATVRSGTRTVTAQRTVRLR